MIKTPFLVLLHYIEVNGMKEKREKGILSCFEREYDKDGWHMDIYIAIEP